MKRLTRIVAILLAVTIFSLSLTSCLMTKTAVGEYKMQEGKPKTYAKGKQLWLFWGIVPLGRTNVNTPSNGACEVQTSYTVSDVLISGLTGGIITSYSIKVRVKK